MAQTRGSKHSLKIDGGLWIVLTDLGEGRWQVQLWGPQTMQVNCVGLTTNEAKDRAVALVSLFLLEHRPDIQVPVSPKWRTLLSFDQGSKKVVSMS